MESKSLIATCLFCEESTGHQYPYCNINCMADSDEFYRQYYADKKAKGERPGKDYTPHISKIRRLNTEIGLYRISLEIPGLLKYEELSKELKLRIKKLHSYYGKRYKLSISLPQSFYTELSHAYLTFLESN